MIHNLSLHPNSFLFHEFCPKQALPLSALKERELQCRLTLNYKITELAPGSSLSAQLSQPNCKMSMQSQPQQAGVVYPNSVTRQPAPSSPHSDGSFGTVFIVLAIIVVISAIACCLGRLCSRRAHKQRPHKQNRSQMDLGFEPHKQNHNSRPRERESDLEFGFDKNIAASKPAAGNGETRGFRKFGNGDIKLEPKLGSA